jgi:hypothetical protein
MSEFSWREKNNRVGDAGEVMCASGNKGGDECKIFCVHAELK